MDRVPRAALGVQRHVHVNVDNLIVRLPPQLQILAKLVVALGTLFFLVVLFIQGIHLTLFGLRSFSLAMRMPMAVVYAALPSSVALMIVFTLRGLPKLTQESTGSDGE